MPIIYQLPKIRFCGHQRRDFGIVALDCECLEFTVPDQDGQIPALLPGDSHVVDALAIVVCRIFAALEFFHIHLGCCLDFKPRILADDVTVDVGNRPRVVGIQKALIYLADFLAGFGRELLRDKFFKICADLR